VIYIGIKCDETKLNQTKSNPLETNTRRSTFVKREYGMLIFR